MDFKNLALVAASLLLLSPALSYAEGFNVDSDMSLTQNEISVKSVQLLHAQEVIEESREQALNEPRAFDKQSLISLRTDLQAIHTDQTSSVAQKALANVLLNHLSEIEEADANI
jgi:hypothetical protein